MTKHTTHHGAQRPVGRSAEEAETRAVLALLVEVRDAHVASVEGRRVRVDQIARATTEAAHLGRRNATFPQTVRDS